MRFVSNRRNRTKAWLVFALGEAPQAVLRAVSSDYLGGEFSGNPNISISLDGTIADTKISAQSTIPMISVPDPILIN